MPEKLPPERTIGRARVSIRSGRKALVRVRFSRAARAELRKRHRLRVTLVGDTRDALGRGGRVTRAVAVKSTH